MCSCTFFMSKRNVNDTCWRTSHELELVNAHHPWSIVSRINDRSVFFPTMHKWYKYSRAPRTAIQDTCDHVIARRLRTRVEKSHADSSECSHTRAPSAYSPEEVRRRRERHELAGIEVLSGTLGRAARGWDCNAEVFLRRFSGHPLSCITS